MSVENETYDIVSSSFRRSVPAVAGDKVVVVEAGVEVIVVVEAGVEVVVVVEAGVEVVVVVEAGEEVDSI